MKPRSTRLLKRFQHNVRILKQKKKVHSKIVTRHNILRIYKALIHQIYKDQSAPYIYVNVEDIRHLIPNGLLCNYYGLYYLERAKALYL